MHQWPRMSPSAVPSSYISCSRGRGQRVSWVWMALRSVRERDACGEPNSHMIGGDLWGGGSWAHMSLFEAPDSVCCLSGERPRTASEHDICQPRHLLGAGASSHECWHGEAARACCGEALSRQDRFEKRDALRTTKGAAYLITKRPRSAPFSLSIFFNFLLDFEMNQSRCPEL